MNAQQANRIANRVLYEQIMPGSAERAQQAMGWTDTQIKTQQDKRAKERRSSITNFWDEYKHDIVQVAAMGALMSGVGAPLYAALQAADAAMYVADGDREGAMLAVGFALLPGIGRLGKAAAVQALGKKGMAKLGAKIARAKATKRLALTKAERAAYRVISANKEELAQAMKASAKRLASSKGAQAAKRAATATTRGAGNLAKAAAGMAAVTTTVDQIYKSSGWEQEDIDSQVGGDKILAGLK